jgi:hypothetical protein
MSTNWKTITIADLEDYLVAAQLRALRTAALGESQTDPVERAIADVVGEVRNRVSQCSTNRISATPGTIPPELVRHACYLILEAAQGRIPSLRLEDSQVRAADEARRILREVGKCDFGITQPTDGIAVTDVITGGGAVVVSGRNRPYSRDNLRNL